MLWAPVNFGYEWLYGAIGIDQHIAQYAPKNETRFGFEFTTQAERFRLFGDVVTAIHNNGEGLASLQYLDTNSNVTHTLFTKDEVIHLKDVAILIQRMTWLMAGVAVTFCVLLIVAYRRRIPMPSFKSLLIYALMALVAVTGIIFLIGPHDVFYQLHVWAFPDEHKWFFYYEESLMSTMMKAPDLFGYIAVLLVAVGVLLFVVIMWLLKLVFVQRAGAHA